MNPNRSYLTPNLKLFSIFSMWAETHTYEEERGSIDLIWTACLKKLILPRFLLKPSGFSSVFGLWVNFGRLRALGEFYLTCYNPTNPMSCFKSLLCSLVTTATILTEQSS